MAAGSPPFALAVHLKRGSVGLSASHYSTQPPICLGRSSACLGGDDPCVSRQHVIVAFDGTSAPPLATITWMAKRPGRLRRSYGATEKISCGMQRQLRHGDILTLLADSGRHPVLFAMGAVAKGGAPLRPDARSWALIEANSLADARAAAREELVAHTASNQALVDSLHEQQQQQQQQDDAEVVGTHAEGSIGGWRAADRHERPAQQQWLRENAAPPQRNEEQEEASQQPPLQQPPPPRESRLGSSTISNPTVHDLIRITRRPSLSKAEEQQPQQQPSGGDAKATSSLLPPPPDVTTSTAAIVAASPTGVGDTAEATATDALALQTKAASDDKASASSLLRRPWRRHAPSEHHALEISIVATVPSSSSSSASIAAAARRRGRKKEQEAKEEAVGLGFRVDAANIVVEVEPYTDAHASGLLVGDVVRAVNGRELPKRQTLHEFLRREFALAGETLRFGVTRTLEEHVEHKISEAVDGERRRRLEIRPNSPRMRGRSKIDYQARWESYKRHPDTKVRRDEHNDQEVMLTQWANGGSRGVMIG